MGHFCVCYATLKLWRP